MKKVTFDPEDRPNLLILITDQERTVMHFPPNWSEKHLTAMTLLKNNGVEFLNGCCNACMCSPSRSTLFSGLYPAQHGVTDTLSFGGKYSITESELSGNMSNLATMLRPHYDVQYRGKWHLSKGGMNIVHPEKSLMAAEVAQFGFRGWIPPDAGEDIALPNFGGGFAEHDARYIEQAGILSANGGYNTKRANAPSLLPWWCLWSIRTTYSPTPKPIRPAVTKKNTG